MKEKVKQSGAYLDDDTFSHHDYDKQRKLRQKVKLNVVGNKNFHNTNK